jgi:alpha-L-fucosidase
MSSLRCELVSCRTLLVERTDRVGRLHFDCPACLRRKAGRCATCQNQVDGKLGVAKYCAPCRLLAGRRHHERYVNKDRARYNRLAAQRIAKKRAEARGETPVLDQQTIGRMRGLARAAALTPERRREIAATANRVRWQKHRQRQMLRRMQEQATPSLSGGHNV